MQMEMAKIAPMIRAPKMILWVLVEAPSDLVGSESLGSSDGKGVLAGNLSVYAYDED